MAHSCPTALVTAEVQSVTVFSLSEPVRFDDRERRYLNTSDDSQIWSFGFGARWVFFFFSFFCARVQREFQVSKIVLFLLPSLRSLPPRFLTAPSLLWKLCSLCGRTVKGQGEKAKKKKKTFPVSSELSLISFDFLGERESAAPCQSDTQGRERSCDLTVTAPMPPFTLSLYPSPPFSAFRLAPLNFII